MTGFEKARSPIGRSVILGARILGFSFRKWSGQSLLVSNKKNPGIES